MKILSVLALATTLVALAPLANAQPNAPRSLGPAQDPARWPSAKANDWYQSRPWVCGFNYVPANAISYTEMFMPDNFDPKRIEREMVEAQKIGLNSARVVLPFVVWEHDPGAFKKRLATLFEIGNRHGITFMPAMFDDCVFGPITDPVYGPQPEVVPGWYANGWTPSPGQAIARDKAGWPRLEKYIKDIVGSFKNDKRVLMWDLYNEAAPPSLELVGKAFDWAREVSPSQPLTVNTFGSPEIRQLTLQRSDIITFHNYGNSQNLEGEIRDLKRSGRPIICTEWLNRNAGSTVSSSLPLFVAENVGCYNWGLVNGRTQTDLNWGHRPGQPLPAQWQHDLFRGDYSPYNSDETQMFSRFIQVARVLRTQK